MQSENSQLKVEGTEARVCFDIVKRQQFGLNKYGVSVEKNPLPLRQWLQHAYEESLDLPIYLKRAMEEIDLQAEVHPQMPKLKDVPFNKERFDRKFMTVLCLSNDKPCLQCAFEKNCALSLKSKQRPECCPDTRDDGNNVYFVKREKTNDTQAN